MVDTFRMHRRCDGVSRREMLRVGGLAGLGLWSFDWFRLRSRAGEAGVAVRSRAFCCGSMVAPAISRPST